MMRAKADNDIISIPYPEVTSFLHLLLEVTVSVFPTVVCPLSLQVENVLVTFLTRLKLAVAKDNFLR